jgi:hypothetical protein
MARFHPDPVETVGATVVAISIATLIVACIMLWYL